MGTPTRNQFSTVPGTLLIHKKWKNATLFHELKGKFNHVFTQDLGLYDFCLSGGKLVIYIPESALVASVNPEKYLEFTKNDTTLVIAVRNTITAEQYSHLQDVLVINNSKKLIPIGDATEICDILQQMAFLEITPKKLSKSKTSPNHLNILFNIPGLGKQKVVKLLDTFGTVSTIAKCTVSELSDVLGLNLAIEVHGYFH